MALVSVNFNRIFSSCFIYLLWFWSALQEAYDIFGANIDFDDFAEYGEDEEEEEQDLEVCIFIYHRHPVSTVLSRLSKTYLLRLTD